MKNFVRAAVLVTACYLGVFAAETVRAQQTEYPVDPAFSAAYAEVKDGRRLVLENNYEAARVIVAPLAEAGNPVAQNLLGIILEHGSGEGASLLPALDSYAQAMAQGYGKAFANAAMIYQDGGVDVPIDLALMMQTYRDGADVGYGPAHEEWVWHLLWGDASVQDHAAGFVQAQTGVARFPDSPRLRTMLADAHYYGMGTPQDDTAALKHNIVAATLGDAYGQFSAGYQYFYGLGADLDNTTARVYFEQAAGQDYGWAYGYLANIYYSGYDVAPDYERAFSFARLGEGRDDGQAGYFVGEAYRTGQGIEQDFNAARVALIKAGADGYSDALTSLADMAYFGEGEPEDLAKAFDLFDQTIAANPDDEYGLYSLGYMLMRGEGVETDYGRAVEMIERAVALGHIDATFEAILLYGSADFTGAHSDPVRATAFCLFGGAEGYFTTDDPDQTVHDTCAYAAAQLTNGQRIEARTIADAL